MPILFNFKIAESRYLRRFRAPLALAIVFSLAGCSTTLPSVVSPSRVAVLREADLETELPARLVGRWEGEVDLTVADRTLVISSVRRQERKWIVEAQYGTIGISLTPIAVTLEVSGGTVNLQFVTQLTSVVRLKLHDGDSLQGSFRLATDLRERSIKLRRVTSAPAVAGPVPSTALERLTQGVRSAAATQANEPGPQVGEGAALQPPVLLSTLGDPIVALPTRLIGRWEGEVDLAVSSRVLLIESVQKQKEKWVVQARYGLSERDLTPVPVVLETTGDRVLLRFVTDLASRVNLTLYEDESLRGSFQLAFDARDRRIELRKVPKVPAAEALTVAFRYPPDQARVTEALSVVNAIVTSAKGVAQASVTLNGKEVHRQGERGTPKSVVVSVPITLREGPNVIVVSATESDGTVRQELRTIFHERSAVSVAPKQPPALAPATRDRWAVVIGVGRYENNAIAPLHYAAADAEAVYQTLIEAAGFEKDHVLLLTDRTETKPTLRNIRGALGTFLARSARKNDIVVIFFAGHGAPEVDPQGAERDGLSKYLIPTDADPDDLYSTALPMDEIQNIFGRIEAESVVVFLDTCYSGAAGGRTFTSKRIRAGGIDDLFLDRLTRSKGRAIITASRASEVAIELRELGHGIFTYYLLQGLKGAADLNRDGIVSLQELYEYVEQQVVQKSRAVGGNQHPVMKGELEGVFPLVKVRQ